MIRSLLCSRKASSGPVPPWRVAFLLLGLLFVRPMPVHAADPVEPDIEDLRRAALRGNGSAQAGEAYEALFAKAGRERIQEFENDPDVGLALHAAWHLTLHPEGLAAVRDPNRFLGFLQGRTGVKPPLRWEVFLVLRWEWAQTKLGRSPAEKERIASLIKAYSGIMPGIVEAPNGGHGLEPEHPKRVGPGLLAYPDTEVKLEQGKVTIVQGKLKAIIPETVIDAQLRTPSGRLSGVCVAWMSSSRAVVALDRRMGGELPVICVDSLTGRLIWKATLPPVLAGSETHEYSGPLPFQDIRLASDGKVLGVFRVNANVCSLDTMDMARGTMLYRFATDYGH